MFIKNKKCELSLKMKSIRLNNFLYVFNLRQGTILIAVHQIALSAFVLIILLVGLSHVGKMMSMLNSDMEDDAERRGFYEIAYGEHLTFHEGGVVSSNNQLRFAKAQDLAEVTIDFFYASTFLTALYLLSCIGLLHGAVKYKSEYLLLWIPAASVSVIMLIVGIVIGDGYPSVVNIFGGHNFYRFGCAIFVLTFIYAICAVFSFMVEIGMWLDRATQENDERGERLLLLDHAAHSSLLSAAQLNKISHGTRSQFV